MRSQSRTHLLAAATVILGASALSLQGAHAELPDPESLPGGSLAPVYGQEEGTAPLIAPVFGPEGETPVLHAPVFALQGPGPPLLAPIHGMDGTWESVNTEEGEQFTLSGEVHFEKHEATLTSTATEILDQVAESWDPVAPPRATVVGHTDTDGEADDNQDLSERRAQAVADYLSSAAPDVDFEVFGKGESEPLEDETEGTAEEQAEAKDKNRRVVLTVPHD